MKEENDFMPVHTILVVDDEAAIRDMLCIALEAADYNVIQAENAQQAHAAILDRNPDLVLLDWMMPGTTGLELLRRLKRDELTEKIPVIMLTAKAEEDSKIYGLDSGADDYISKPFSPRELVSRVKAVLRRVGREDLDEPISVGELLFDPLDVEKKKSDIGIIICGSGNGAAMTANKHHNIRAALEHCTKEKTEGVIFAHHRKNLGEVKLLALFMISKENPTTWLLLVI